MTAGWRPIRGVLGFSAIVLAACGPGLPSGVDRGRLHAAISSAIGDPNTCVLIAPAGGGRVAFRYNSHITCARTLPTCQGADQGTVADLLKAVAADGQARALSCPSSPDGARTAAWAAGPAPGRALVYAAVMEGERALPSRVMAERLARAFKAAGL